MFALSFTQPLEDAFSKMFTSIGAVAPKLLAAILILIVGMMVAKFLRKLVAKGLKALKIDAFIEKSSLAKHLKSVGSLSGLLASVVYWMFALIIFQAAADALGKGNAISDLIKRIVNIIPSIVVAMVLLMITALAADKIGGVIRGAAGNKPWGKMASSIVVGIVWFIGVFAAIDNVDVAKDTFHSLFDKITDAFFGALKYILAIALGVGGIAGARDHFWPKVYGALNSDKK